jgi:hypothetical protein
MGNFDRFLTIADYNEYSGRMSAMGRVTTRDHIHVVWIWSKEYKALWHTASNP